MPPGRLRKPRAERKKELEDQLREKEKKELPNLPLSDSNQQENRMDGAINFCHLRPRAPIYDSPGSSALSSRDSSCSRASLDEGLYLHPPQFTTTIIRGSTYLEDFSFESSETCSNRTSQTSLSSSRSWRSMDSLDSKISENDDVCSTISAMQYSGDRTIVVQGLSNGLLFELALEFVRNRAAWIKFVSAEPFNLTLRQLDDIEVYSNYTRRLPFECVITHWQRLEHQGSLHVDHSCSATTLHKLLVENDVEIPPEYMARLQQPERS